VDDGHPAYDDVSRAPFVQRAADRQEVFEEGRTRLEGRAIIRIDHA